MNVGVVGKPTYHDLSQHLAVISRAAPRLGITLYTEELLRPYWPPPAPAAINEAGALDFLITLGGDGTLLRAAHILNGARTPILGINLGRVGFLTTATAEALADALQAMVKQAYATEARLTLSAVITNGGKLRGAPATVLNDVVIHKGGVARVVRMRVLVDGDEVGQYSADGLIMATPTGSTAYSLSAGGPIIVPGVDAIVVTAICPHTLAVRPLVLPSQSVVTVEPIPPWTEDVLVSFDGQSSTSMQEGDMLIVRRAEHPVLLVRLGAETFFDRIRMKLRWGDLTDRERR